MGRQVSFYFSDMDQAELASMLETNGAMAMAEPFSQNVVCPESPAEAITSFKKIGHIYLFRAQDQKQVATREFGSKNGFTVDIFKSAAVEFSVCKTFDSYISRGRLYFVAFDFDAEGRRIDKSPDFVKWADKQIAAVKKLAAVRRFGFYIGREALQLERKGFRFQP